jgi:hypothetical protein
MCGIGRGAMAGRCGGGADGGAGAAGRAMAGGGAGRAIAGGGAGRAMTGGGAAGRAAAAGGPGLLCSWADEPSLAATTETPRRNAAKRRPGVRMIVATCYYQLFGSLVAGHLNARPQQSIGACHCGFATQGDGIAAACARRQIPFTVKFSC